jgi:alpha-D-xyloside xylohydrolase
MTGSLVVSHVFLWSVLLLLPISVSAQQLEIHYINVHWGGSVLVKGPNGTTVLLEAGSIIPFGPYSESASAKPDPIELRIYTGASASFTLYEDEGDNYDYEHGAYSEIPIRWDDKSGLLTIGNRRGRFPGMLEHRTFRVVIVRDGRGTGIASSSEPDATVGYAGKTTSVRLRSRL